MATQMIFKRYEMKYLLTLEQKAHILRAMAPYMQQDAYGRTTIRNIYYDTEHYRLIRRSIEKPVYKEKLRLRSYASPDADTPIFVELKKKYNSVVYKRRLCLPQSQALDWINNGGSHSGTQIAKEIDYFIHYYEPLRPSVFLTYEREAYFDRGGSDFRVTFDDNILCRRDNLSLAADIWGVPLLPQGMVLMELKTAGAVPLWMTQVLSEEHIYKTTFSKYGAAYRALIHTRQSGGNAYA